MILGIDHIQLAMPAGGEESARKFYRDILELKEVPKPPRLSVRGGCWFTGAINIHLGVEVEFRPAQKAHPAFIVADLRNCAHKLSAAGFAVHWDESIPHRKRFFCADPFGNRIEFVE